MESGLKTCRFSDIELSSVRFGYLTNLVSCLNQLTSKSLVQSHLLHVFEGLGGWVQVFCVINQFFSYVVCQMCESLIFRDPSGGGKVDFVCVTIQFIWSPPPPPPLGLRSYLMIFLIGSQFSLLLPLSSVSDDWSLLLSPPLKTTWFPKKYSDVQQPKIEFFHVMEAIFKYFNIIKVLQSRLSLRSSKSRVRCPPKVWLKYVIGFLEYQNLSWPCTSV